MTPSSDGFSCFQSTEHRFRKKISDHCGRLVKQLQVFLSIILKKHCLFCQPFLSDKENLFGCILYHLQLVFLSNMLISEHQCKYTRDCQLTSSTLLFSDCLRQCISTVRRKKITQNKVFSHSFPQAKTQNGLIINMWLPTVQYFLLFNNCCGFV